MLPDETSLGTAGACVPIMVGMSINGCHTNGHDGLDVPPGPDVHHEVLHAADVTKHVNKRILRVAQDYRNLLAFVRDHGSELHVLNVCTILHRIAKRIAKNPRTFHESIQVVKQSAEWQELLAHLRRLAPICNNMELSNCLWSLATLEMREEHDTIRVLAELSIKHIGSFDARNLALSAWALAKLGVKYIDWCRPFADETLRKLDVFPAVRDMTMMVWAFATVHWRDDDFLRRFCEEVEAREDAYTTQDIGNTLWALATLACRDEKALAALSRQCFLKAEVFDQQALSISLWSYATLQYRNQNLLHYLTQQATERVSTLSAQGMANIVWACAKFGFQQKCLLMTIAEEAIPRFDEFEPQHLAITAWGYATLDFPNRPMLSALCQAATRKVHTFSPQHIANLTWAMATLAHKDEEYLTHMARRAIEMVDDFNPQECSNLAWALALLTFRDDALLEAISRRSQEIVSEFIPQNLGNSAWAYNRLGYRDEALICTLAQQAARALPECQGQEIFDLIEAVTTGNYIDAVDPEVWTTINNWTLQRYDRAHRFLDDSCGLPLKLSAMSDFERALAVQDYQVTLASFNIIGLGYNFTGQLFSNLGVDVLQGSELEEWRSLARCAAAGHELNATDAAKNFEAQEGLKACRTICVYRYSVRAATETGWSTPIEQGPTAITSGQPDDSYELGLFAATLRHNRAADCEFKALQAFARMCSENLGWQLYGDIPADGYGIEGDLWLYTSEVPCFSCVGATGQFRRLFPGIKVHIAYNMGRQPAAANTTLDNRSVGLGVGSGGAAKRALPAPKPKPEHKAKPKQAIVRLNPKGGWEVGPPADGVAASGAVGEQKSGVSAVGAPAFVMPSSSPGVTNGYTHIGETGGQTGDASAIVNWQGASKPSGPGGPAIAKTSASAGFLPGPAAVAALSPGSSALLPRPSALSPRSAGLSAAPFYAGVTPDTARRDEALIVKDEQPLPMERKASRRELEDWAGAAVDDADSEDAKDESIVLEEAEDSCWPPVQMPSRSQQSGAQSFY